MENVKHFDDTFQSLTDNPPFPWQIALHHRLMAGDIPSTCNLPTGLGKTSVIACWLIALAHGAKVPRRLVYVVNRRTVVDQTTNEVEKYRKNLTKAGLWDQLASLSATPATIDTPPLAISTLRGQFADNREWSVDPSRPAVICGTVDMIGSRLLFSGYGVGFKAKPLHAGFLGQDAVLVHDEAHLEPAFQALIETIEKEQQREPGVPWPKFRVMELTATRRSSQSAFGLTSDDRIHPVIIQRINAAKRLFLHSINDAKKLAVDLATKALEFRESGKAILIFAQKLETVMTVRDFINKANMPVEVLTGTIRGKERDDLVTKPVFARFLPDRPTNAEPGTVFLVCTSAGEVGVNISADHLICDLSTFESMAQRFGRVNRFGKFPDCEVHVFFPTEWDDKPLTIPRKKTLALLEQLPGQVNSESLSALPESNRLEAFAPKPTILPATDILFDAWTLTSINDKLPGRPIVEPFLHGLSDWQPAETKVAWREEVGKITGELLDHYQPKMLFDFFPLLPREILKDRSDRVFRQFEFMAKRLGNQMIPVWIIDDDGTVEVLTIAELADKDNKEQIERKTVILPPFAGGLSSSGMLDGSLATADDVSETKERCRVWNEEEDPVEMHLMVAIHFDNAEGDDDESKSWRWFEKRNEGDKSAKKPVTWKTHISDVERFAKGIVERLQLDRDLRHVVMQAARFHDHGKRRKLFQTLLGNSRWPEVIMAKSGRRSNRLVEKYRHEFGSLIDVLDEPDFETLTHHHQDIVLHLIAAHHGRARPHFRADEAFDPERSHALAERIARETPRRFALLQRKFGRWGLAYLESLLRAADWAASNNPSEYWEGQ